MTDSNTLMSKLREVLNGELKIKHRDNGKEDRCSSKIVVCQRCRDVYYWNTIPRRVCGHFGKRAKECDCEAKPILDRAEIEFNKFVETFKEKL